MKNACLGLLEDSNLSNCPKQFITLLQLIVRKLLNLRFFEKIISLIARRSLEWFFSRLAFTDSKLQLNLSLAYILWMNEWMKCTFDYFFSFHLLSVADIGSRECVSHRQFSRSIVRLDWVTKDRRWGDVTVGKKATNLYVGPIRMCSRSRPIFFLLGDIKICHRAIPFLNLSSFPSLRFFFSRNSSRTLSCVQRLCIR